MARAIDAEGLVPDRILCSPARRTRETLAALLPYVGGEGRVSIDPKLYNSAPANTLPRSRARGATREPFW